MNHNQSQVEYNYLFSVMLYLQNIQPLFCSFLFLNVLALNQMPKSDVYKDYDTQKPTGWLRLYVRALVGEQTLHCAIEKPASVLVRGKFLLLNFNKQSCGIVNGNMCANKTR